MIRNKPPNSYEKTFKMRDEPMLSECNTTVDRYFREQAQHGTIAFPCACYHDELAKEDVPWHWHDELEAAIVTEGAIHVVIGGEQFDLDTGDGFFVNASALHSCQGLTPEGCRLHSLVFHPRLIGGGAESSFNQNYVLPVTQNKGFAGMRLDRGDPWQGEMLDKVEEAWQACVQECPRFDLKARYALSAALALIAEHMVSVKTDISPKQLRDSERVKAMLQFIMDNYGEAIDTAAIARSASVSESECLRCFRATIGTTPIRYLREYRIEQAANRLANSQASIADIAAACGFQDISYFTKTFREMKGLTPKAYRMKQ